jgi:hypothetical protein
MSAPSLLQNDRHKFPELSQVSHQEFGLRLRRGGHAVERDGGAAVDVDTECIDAGEVLQSLSTMTS